MKVTVVVTSIEAANVLPAVLKGVLTEDIHKFVIVIYSAFVNVKRPEIRVLFQV